MLLPMNDLLRKQHNSIFTTLLLTIRTSIDTLVPAVFAICFPDGAIN